MIRSLFGLGGATKMVSAYQGPKFSVAQNATKASSSGSEVAIVCNGCYWGTEHMYRQAFEGKGLLDAEVGFIGGKVTNPSYRQVCTGSTGHAEGCKITFDPSQLTYAQLIEFFYASHDATDKGGQGPDRGTQYLSKIFYTSPEQQQIAQDVTAEVQKEYYDAKGKKIVTDILSAKDNQWYSAEEYHQKYLHNNPSGYECPSHFLRF